MADLRNILGGNWTPPAEKQIDPPEIQLINAMLSIGITPPDRILMDGKIHRFRSGTNGKQSGDKTGWYVAFNDGVPAGRFGCWRAGLEHSFRADIGREISAAEEMAIARRLSEARAKREEEQRKTQEAAAISIESIWSSCGHASNEHPYLKRKGVQAHGSRVTGDGRLIVPLFSKDGELASLQYIDNDGGKLYHSGAATKGLSWMIGEYVEGKAVYLAEGFATAATIHEATNLPCVAAYTASNLLPVTEMLYQQFGQSLELIIVADNDESGIGQKYADQASAKFGARVIMPPVKGDANDYAQSGHDILDLLIPKVDQSWLVQADDFSSQPAPISWIIKGWIQSEALIMVHGPSGGGKTFCVLDMCLSVASSKKEWANHRVTNGPVVYLAGEGHHGLRGRIAAWKIKNNEKKLNMWLSKTGCDLNQTEGYRKAVDSIRAIKDKPKIIIVDTLHRFLNGDENSAQDAKTMLDACAALMNEFKCSVLLVHHTGVSGDAQHRARGSSAWRGALDIEISVIPQSEEDPIQIVQRKSKDAELAQDIYAKLESVEIDDWIDEDGEQVTSAVLSITEEKPKEKAKKESKLESFRKQFERSWWHGGAEVREDKPYVSRSALKDFLIKDGLSDAYADRQLKPSFDSGIIFNLQNGEIIKPFEHGWIVIDSVMASAMMIRK